MASDLSFKLPSYSGNFQTVQIYFGGIPVSGSETFTIKFESVKGPGALYFMTHGIGTAPCENIEETAENNVEDPTERSDPAGFKVLAE